MEKKIQKGYVTQTGIEWIENLSIVAELKQYWIDRGERIEWVDFMVEALEQLDPAEDPIKIGAFMVARAV